MIVARTHMRMLCRQLEVQGRVRRPQVGMKLLELNAANAAQLRARDASFPKVSAGILVPSVSPGLPAHAAGLRAGDVIIGAHTLSSNSTPLSNPEYEFLFG